MLGRCINRIFDTLADNICNLQDQKHQLEQFVFRFKNSNKKYLKVKSIAEEVVNRLLTEQESLLDLALNAVIEALRMNPEGMLLFTIARKKSIIVIGVAILVSLFSIYGILYILTPYSGFARSIIWGDSNIKDYERYFPFEKISSF
jgi:hypothetical protein